ncbi:MAG: coagulation factor 5/8 type domain-containing protein [Bacteroidales bacterium]|nr:coagulation factor 5/8 type domain-containing protein [Bacteroidales bacterium]
MSGTKRILLLILLLVTGSLSSNCQIDLKKYNHQLLGENVFVFDPSMDMKDIQTVIDTLFKRQSARRSEFSKNRYALLFKPGTYNLDVKVDYYMHVAGLGQSPEDVVINGAVRSNTTHGNSVLTNFWRAVENMTIIPTAENTMIWGVSQAAPMRRVHIKGNLQLFDKGYASGGFLADSKVDGTVTSGPQQQWLSRNTDWKEWIGGNWNMMFIGVPNAPAGEWPEKPYTRIDRTPVIREKPYITSGKKGFEVMVPQLSSNTTGPTWTDSKRIDKPVNLKNFFIAKAGTDNSETINNALKEGKNLLFTPGIYYLNNTIKVTRPGTIIMGLGLPSLMPVNGTSAIELSDVDGITVCGITIDAGPKHSETLFIVGEKGSAKSHPVNPAFLYDIFFRVGGPAQGSATSCMIINSRNVYIDHIWLWRADHGNGVGWDKNRGANGLIVNGDDVTIYGLFNEHFQEYQTLWNGNNGKVYFYQSEMPYDPPTVDSWKHGDTYGYASYKVSDNVKSHEAWGIGIYNVFYDAPVIVDNAIETPPELESSIHNKIIFWLNGNKESVVKSIINGKGDAVNVNNRKSIMK